MRRLAAILALGLSLAACEREERDARGEPAAEPSKAEAAMPTIAPGGGSIATPPNASARSYEASAYHVAQGKKLYVTFNCNGCHAHGGGDSGPPLMDDRWIYGGEIEQIAATIREGRPNGMPAFRALIPEPQILEISAYVRSMGRNVSQDVAPARNDDLSAGEAEQRRPRGEVKPGGDVPTGGEQPQ